MLQNITSQLAENYSIEILSTICKQYSYHVHISNQPKFIYREQAEQELAHMQTHGYMNMDQEEQCWEEIKKGEKTTYRRRLQLVRRPAVKCCGGDGPIWGELAQARGRGRGGRDGKWGFGREKRAAELGSGAAPKSAGESSELGGGEEP